MYTESKGKGSSRSFQKWRYMSFIVRGAGGHRCCIIQRIEALRASVVLVLVYCCFMGVDLQEKEKSDAVDKGTWAIADGAHLLRPAGPAEPHGGVAVLAKDDSFPVDIKVGCGAQNRAKCKAGCKAAVLKNRGDCGAEAL
jgi:hypothetical protein